MSEYPVERLMQTLSAMNQLFAKQLETLQGGVAGPASASLAAAQVGPARLCLLRLHPSHPLLGPLQSPRPVRVGKGSASTPAGAKGRLNHLGRTSRLKKVCRAM